MSLGLPSGWFPRRSPRDPGIALGDGSPEQERPADAHPLAGRYEPQHVGVDDVGGCIEGDPVVLAQALRESTLAVIAQAYDIAPEAVGGEPPTRDPGEANRRPDFPEAPDYSRRALGALARIDDALDGNLRATNQRLRRDLTAAIDARRLVEHERDAALARVAELELTLRALGRVVMHAAGHDAVGGG
jgi:hypothetical protein